ncbi:YncE family protein [Enterococcus xiangfangensis]|uniref:YncE family protein n=1 Tax=Enterococcus xiangfangensis TaxID=1296537 RepID=UPI003D164BF6|nr:hypothetical protein [Enterococcus asini]
MKNFFCNLNNWLRRFLGGFFFKQRQLEQAFPEFFAAVKRTYPIPGLKESSSLNLSNKKETCTAMTPQGMTLTEEYLLISAYCYDHCHHSVIYVLDRNTGDKIKTVILPDLPHVGGLAYDPTQQNIWLSHTAGPYAAVAAIPLVEIENYIDDSLPIAYQQKVVLKELSHASALTYDRKYLVTALFSVKNFGEIVCYPIESTNPLKRIKKSKQTILESPFGTLAIPKKIQGVTFYKNFLLLSQSWGRQTGKIFIFDIQETTDFSDTQQAIKIISTPPYLEQIYVENDQLFALFESGAVAYQQKTPFVLKEVLQLDLSILLK